MSYLQSAIQHMTQGSIDQTVHNIITLPPSTFFAAKKYDYGSYGVWSNLLIWCHLLYGRVLE